MDLSHRVGDRVALRDRPWTVRKVTTGAESSSILEVEALDGLEPSTLSAVCPPEECRTLPPQELSLDPECLESYEAWSRGHRILYETLIRETGLLVGARFGRVNPEAYQLEVTKRLLAKPRPSLLVADDVGLGKTIEAGMALLELSARGRAKRVLIVTPPGLLLQWEEELREKFGLRFTVIANATSLSVVQSDLPAGVSPWDALPRVLTSMDYLKKETLRTRALRKTWDLIIVDEAHAVAESGTSQNPYSTQRTRLGRALRDSSRGLLLLTATPHNGYSHSFRSLIELVEPTLATFHGDKKDRERRIQAARIRRMKDQIRRRNPDGTEERVFPLRNVEGIPVKGLEAREVDLLRKVASYCSRVAQESEGGDDEDLVVFAMQIVKKRALSSRAALLKTLEHRLEALRKEEARESPPDRAEIRDLQANLPLGEVASERTVCRILRSAIPKEERRRRSELKALNAIQRLARALPPRDPKIEALMAELARVLGADPTEKVIVFTEYLDTLEAVRQRLEVEPSLRGRSVILRGGLSPRQRLKRQAAFELPGVSLLLATDAASEGLNLQRCCHRVLHMELPWNPNRLEQRNGRVDRYGQVRNPEIRYLYLPDSPEEDVLNTLVNKIERMRKDRISTPDILGVLGGDGEIERGLVGLDPEAPDVEKRKRSLVARFDVRTDEFIRNVQPLICGGEGGLLDVAETATLSAPLLADDASLETLVLGILGTRAVSPGPVEGTYRVLVPPGLRGPGVDGVYPAATFRLSVAIRSRSSEVEFLTPIHPLVREIAADARRQFLQVYSADRGLAPRRLAACRVPVHESASVLFTFLSAVQGGAGLLEEAILPIRVDLNGRVLGDLESNLSLLSRAAPAGEVDADTLVGLFGNTFHGMSRRAAVGATAMQEARVTDLRARRQSQSEILLEDLGRDLRDRLDELAEADKRAKGMVEDSGQRRLFAFEDGGVRGIQARRAAVEAQVESRRVEIAEFASFGVPSAPRPLGALLLVPEGA